MFPNIVSLLSTYTLSRTKKTNGRIGRNKTQTIGGEPSRRREEQNNRKELAVNRYRRPDEHHRLRRIIAIPSDQKILWWAGHIRLIWLFASTGSGSVD
jgi:hypothetical protein